MLPEFQIPLAPYNTFGLASTAHRLARIRHLEDVQQLIHEPSFDSQQNLILGGGSNLVLARDIAEWTIKVELLGKTITEKSDDWLIEIQAGESWDELVQWTIAHGCYGLENLAFIPGTVGAAPVQNIGAYGIELERYFESLDYVDLKTGRLLTLSKNELQFAYRHSIFKAELAKGALITAVRLVLPKRWQPVLTYSSLSNVVSASSSARAIYEAVRAIRQSKLPDPKQIGNAGSFFKNPRIPKAQFQELIQQFPKLVHYRDGLDHMKLAAGWLIEACGFKGQRVGDAGVCETQALVLVNHGKAKASEVLALAHQIQDAVSTRFGVSLEMEPRCVV